MQCAACGVVTYALRLAPADLAHCYPPDYYAYALEPPGDPASWRPRLRALIDDLHLGLRRAPLLRLLLAPLLAYKEVYSTARHLRGVPPARLLDVGCGAGGFLLKARRLGFAAEGIEPGLRPDGPLAAAFAAWGIDVVAPGDAAPTTAPPATAASAASSSAASSSAASSARITIHACAIEAFDPGDARFDLVTLHHVLEHLDDPAVVWGRLDRWLAPGGRVLVRMPDTDSLGFRRHRRCWFGLEVPRHTFLFDRENFARFAARHGYRVVRARKECVPLHWQYALKRLLTGRLYAEPSWLDHPLLSFALLPLVPVFHRLGWADMMAVWLERDSAAAPSPHDAPRAAPPPSA